MAIVSLTLFPNDKVNGESEDLKQVALFEAKMLNMVSESAKNERVFKMS